MPWATTDDVTDLTRVTVDDETLAMAQGVVELFSGVTETQTDDFSVRDLRHLKMAVAYQASFISANPEMFGRAGVQQFAQDGISFTATNSLSKQSADDVLVLSPLSRLALRRLSWNGSMRSIQVSRGLTRYETWEDWRDAWLRCEVDTCHPLPGFNSGMGQSRRRGY